MTKTANIHAANSKSDNHPAGAESHTAKVEIFEPNSTSDANSDSTNAAKAQDDSANAATVSQKKLDPTRYGDWEKNGRCIDF